MVDGTPPRQPGDHRADIVPESDREDRAWHDFIEGRFSAVTRTAPPGHLARMDGIAIAASSIGIGGAIFLVLLLDPLNYYEGFFYWLALMLALGSATLVLGIVSLVRISRSDGHLHGTTGAVVAVVLGALMLWGTMLFVFGLLMLFLDTAGL